MICPNCGRVYNSRFCPSCGTPMVSEEQMQRPQFQQFHTPPAQKSNDNRNIAMICLIFLAVAVLSAAVYFVAYFFLALWPFFLLML